MALAIASYLQPLSEAEPCGPALRHHDTFAELRELSSAAERVDWARAFDKAETLAREGRDLRVWVWLCRTALCREGLPGLAAGLELIAEGLAGYWDVLPPVDLDETDPGERFLGRLMALAELGVTSSRANLDDLTRGNRNVTDLRADLDTMVAKAPGNAESRAALERARAAIDAIGEIFRRQFGDAKDPQLGFELLLGRLKALEPKLGANGAGETQAADAARGSAAPANALGPVSSRDDVIRALNLVLEYYVSQEPSSPVPLLVQRAKKLVSMSFLDAMRELAPAGMKELQAVAGATDEKK